MARNLILDDEMLEIVERYLIFPEYIEVATNWWCEKLRSSKFNDEEDEPGNTRAAYEWNCSCVRDMFSEEVERSFRFTLSCRIESGIDQFYQVGLYSDYSPTGLLDTVCRDIDFYNDSIFPRDTTMLISEEEVVVMQGENKEILWSAY